VMARAAESAVSHGQSPAARCSANVVAHRWASASFD
jgi:hypothetical protein